MPPSPSNPRKLACKVLQTIFRTQAFADDVFDAEIKNVVLSDQDCTLAFELVYGVLRHAVTLKRTNSVEFMDSLLNSLRVL